MCLFLISKSKALNTVFLNEVSHKAGVGGGEIA
jgi:hypothetical protein